VAQVLGFATKVFMHEYLNCVARAAFFNGLSSHPNEVSCCSPLYCNESSLNTCCPKMTSHVLELCY
jgi:hypothetical protein